MQNSLDAIEAKIYDNERKNLSMNGIKFNESVLEAKVRTNPQYLQSARNSTMPGTLQICTSTL